MASEKQSVYFQPRKVNKKSLFRSPWLGSPETSGIQTAVRTAKGVDDASSGKRMMEETDNGRGLVTLHRRQEGGRQTRVGAGREKRVIPASWNHPPAVAAESSNSRELSRELSLLQVLRRGELCPLLLRCGQRRARGIGWLLDLDHPFSLGQTPESWSRWGLYFIITLIAFSPMEFALGSKAWEMHLTSLWMRLRSCSWAEPAGSMLWLRRSVTVTACGRQEEGPRSGTRNTEN